MILGEAQGGRPGKLESRGLNQLLQPRLGVNVRQGGRYKVGFLVDQVDEEWNRRYQAGPEEVDGSLGSHLLIDDEVTGWLC